MKYILEPLNEGQEMNCMVPFEGTHRAMLSRAYDIAKALDAALGCDITVRSRRRSKLKFSYGDEMTGIRVYPDGTVWNEQTGDRARITE